MKKSVKIIVLVLLVGFVGIQFFSTSRNQSDTIPKTDFMLVNDVPKQVENIIKTSCYDCHSNNTDYPWYNKVQPVAWFLEDHVTHGKEELNFNEWADYSNRRKNSKLKSIISQIENGEMPLWSYTLIHREAKLSEDKRKTVLDWVSKLKDSL
ncbi:heme-binding domain-containing protein [Muricauda sp. 334s03]|uniref:Heme-binding domain-containing protein n=1 Tax=Flagellimonas yonaguniensis TaxID=3031325 RepID=A0ABT5XZI0_9FLAO|nr:MULTISPECIES: heme-binding domain-containing protein [Flavobacteriaceae]MDF0716597.1 heme-binding domain-containing protein [[Muricauda] yonaguniensis]